MLPYFEIYIYTYINTDETPRVVLKNAKFTARIGVQNVRVWSYIFALGLH